MVALGKDMEMCGLSLEDTVERDVPCRAPRRDSAFALTTMATGPALVANRPGRTPSPPVRAGPTRARYAAPVAWVGATTRQAPLPPAHPPRGPMPGQVLPTGDLMHGPVPLGLPRGAGGPNVATAATIPPCLVGHGGVKQGLTRPTGFGDEFRNL